MSISHEIRFRDVLRSRWTGSSIDDWWRKVDPVIYAQSRQSFLIEYFSNDGNVSRSGFIKKKRLHSPAIPETIFTMMELVCNDKNDPALRCWYPDFSPFIGSESKLNDRNSKDSKDDYSRLLFEILHVDGLVFHPYNLSRVIKRSLLDDLVIQGKKADLFAVQVFFKASSKTWENKKHAGKSKMNLAAFCTNNQEIVSDMVMDELVAASFLLGIQVVVACKDKRELARNVMRMKAVFNLHGLKAVKARGNEKERKKNLKIFLSRSSISKGVRIPPSMLKKFLNTRKGTWMEQDRTSNETCTEESHLPGGTPAGESLDG